MVKMKGGQPKYFYEMTDHLGNVRTVIGSSYTDNFVATMEPANATKESRQFVDITSTAITYTSANTTSGGSYVSRLNAQQNGSIAPHIVGPGIIIPVAPGDVISASVNGYFETGTYSNTNLPIPTMVAALVGALSGVTPGDPSVLQSSMTTTYTSDPLIAGELGNSNTTVPHGYLNMVVFDGNLNYVTSNQSMSQAVGFQANATAGTKIPLSFSNIPITSPGWAYIWVDVNGADNNFVYFDDLSISQLHSPYVAGGDFYPFGLTMDDRLIKSERYRYGYQGQFSEYDSLTKTNNFQLRLYDPRFGRWLSPDPYGQFVSPYLAMGNDPVSGTDPDGGLCCLSAEELGEAFSLAREEEMGVAAALTRSSNATMLSGVKIIDSYTMESMMWDASHPMPQTVSSAESTFDAYSHVGGIPDWRTGATFDPRNVIKPMEPSFFRTWGSSTNFLAKASFSVVDGIYVTAQFFTPWRTTKHIDGYPTVGWDKANAFASTAPFFFSFGTSSLSTAPSRTYTIYNAQGDLWKFGVTDANFVRMNQSLAEAGAGATARYSNAIMPKWEAHLMEKYLRSLHFNSTGTWQILGMKIPYPRSFITGKPIKP